MSPLINAQKFIKSKLCCYLRFLNTSKNTKELTVGEPVAFTIAISLITETTWKQQYVFMTMLGNDNFGYKTYLGRFESFTASFPKAY